METPIVQASANTAENLVESAPTETKVDQQLSESAESASANPTLTAPKTEEIKTSEATGSEPVVEPQVVEELKKVRRRAQQAEQELRQKAEETAQLRGQLEERTRQQTPAASESKTNYDGTRPPTVNDFENYDDYMRESIKYDLRKDVEKQRVVELQKQQAEKQKKVDTAFFARVAAVVDKLPDYDDAVKTLPFLGNEVLQAIKESEAGPEIAYHLAKNPNEAIRITQLGGYSAVREIGKIEAKLVTVEPTKKITKQVSQAPEPIKPINAASTATPADYNTMSTEDFMKKRTAETTYKVGNRVVLKH